MRQFMILFDEIPIDRASVKAGNNTSEVITACRCVNVGLFISSNLRRDVVVSIASGTSQDMQIISFPGDTLRRVSPDERSISFFLLKAMEVSKELSLQSSEVMDNGIIVHRTRFDCFLNSMLYNNIIVADRKEHEWNSLNLNSIDNLLIYDNRALQSSLESFGLENFKTIPYPPHPERFILDVNMRADRTQTEP